MHATSVLPCLGVLRAGRGDLQAASAGPRTAGELDPGPRRWSTIKQGCSPAAPSPTLLRPRNLGRAARGPPPRAARGAKMATRPPLGPRPRSSAPTALSRVPHPPPSALFPRALAHQPGPPREGAGHGRGDAHGQHLRSFVSGILRSRSPGTDWQKMAARRGRSRRPPRDPEVPPPPRPGSASRGPGGGAGLGPCSNAAASFSFSLLFFGSFFVSSFF